MAVFGCEGYYDDTIYARTSLQMAMLQKQHPKREIRGIILFLDTGLDPRTEPWTRIIQSISLGSAIARLRSEAPTHPLIAVFQPLLIQDDEILEREAGPCYTWIKHSPLPQPIKEVLLEVFLNWIEKRLSHKGKKEIEKMMLGQLPDLRDTQTGKDLIAIGKLEGKLEALIELIETRFGSATLELREQISKIDSIAEIDRVYRRSLLASNQSEIFGN